MNKKHVFISHAWGLNKEGHKWANHLAERLQRDHGIYCWIDDQEQNLIAGGGLNRQLQLAIQSCPAFVVVLCNAYKASNNCMAELLHAFTHDKKPIPVLREKDVKLKGNLPAQFNIHDQTVFLEMAEIGEFDLLLPKLASAIHDRCRLVFWMQLGKRLGIYKLASAVRHAYISILLGILLFASLLAWMSWEPRARGPTPLPPPSIVIPPTTLRNDRISVPEDGKSAPFHKGGGQGGLVDVEGESRGLNLDAVILLVVNAPDGIDYPQTNQPLGIIPDANGNWTAEVQVGNDESIPLKGLKFTVSMYVLSKKEYLLLKKDNQETGGHAKWPPDWLPAKLTEHAKTRFTLE